MDTRDLNFMMAADLAAVSGVRHRFFGRRGGVSPKPWDSLNVAYSLGDLKDNVDENRAIICAEMGVSKNALYTLSQAHTVSVVRVSATDCPERVRAIEADALWTTDPDIALGVETADCAPLLFADKKGNVVGAVHAGWRGATAGIAPLTIKLVCENLGLQPKDMVVAIGPCIGFDALEVGPEVIKAARAWEPIDGIVKKGEGDRFFLDLAGLLKLQLMRLGVEKVEVLRRCTKTHCDDYFSHRAHQKQRGNQLSVIAK